MNRRVAGSRALFVAASVAAVVIAVAVSACGSPSTASGSPSSASAADPATQSNSPPRGTAGTVAAVTATDIQVQNPRTGQVRVTFTPSTGFTETVTATAADLVVGDCAFATGPVPPADTPAGLLTATSVLISPATGGGTCPARDVRAGTGRGRGTAISGKIASVSGTGFVVQVNNSSTTRAVVTAATTAFTRTVAIDKSGLAVGQCVTAMGPPDDTGTVAASSISITRQVPMVARAASVVVLGDSAEL